MYVCERKGRQKINSDFFCCSERGTMTWRKRRANNWESTHIFFQNEKIGKRRKKLENSINPTGFRRKKWKKNVREKKSDKGRNDRIFFVRKSRTIGVGRSWAIHRHKDERNLMENLCQLGATHLQAALTHWQAISCSTARVPGCSAAPGFTQPCADWLSLGSSGIASLKMAGTTSQQVGGLEGSSKSARRQPLFLEISTHSFDNKRPKTKGLACFQLFKALGNDGLARILFAISRAEKVSGMWHTDLGICL